MMVASPLLTTGLRVTLFSVLGGLFCGLGLAHAAPVVNAVSKPNVSEEGPTTVVTIRGTTTPTFTVYKLERPERVVVDLANARLQADVEPMAVNGWAVAQVSAQALSGEEAAVVRVLVGFARPSEYHVKAVGHDVVVTVTAREGRPLDTQADQANARRKVAEDAAVAAEARRTAAEKAAADAEVRRGAAEADRQKQEAQAQAAKSARAAEEAAVARAEAARKDAEAARKDAETALARVEDARKKAETASAAAEARRTAAEKAAERAAALAQDARASEEQVAKARAEAKRLAAERQVAEAALDARKRELATTSMKAREVEAARVQATADVTAARQAADVARAARASEERERAEVASARAAEEKALAAVRAQRSVEEEKLAAAEAQKQKAGEDAARTVARAKAAGDAERAAATQAAAEATARAQAADAESRRLAAASSARIQEAEKAAALATARAKEVDEQARKAAAARVQAAEEEATRLTAARMQAAEKDAARIAATKLAEAEAAAARLTAARMQAADEEARRLAAAKLKAAGDEADKTTAKTRAANLEAGRVAAAKVKAAEDEAARTLAEARRARVQEETRRAEAEKATRTAEQAAAAAAERAKAVEAQADASARAAAERARTAEAEAQRLLADARASKANADAQKLATEAAERSRVAAEQARAAEDKAKATRAEASDRERRAREAAEARQKDDAAVAAVVAPAKAPEPPAKAEAKPEPRPAVVAAAPPPPRPPAVPAVAAAGRARLKDVDYVDRPEGGRVVLVFDGKPAEARIVAASERQAIVELDNVDIPAKLERTLDTHEFDGPVASVASFRDPRDASRVRVVVDLTGGSAPILAKNVDSLTVDFARPVIARAPATSKAVVYAPPIVGGYGVATTPVTSQTVAQQRGATVRNQRIELDIVNADIHNLMRLLGQAGNVDIIVPDEVKGNVTVKLTNVPWRQAMEVVLASKGLWYRQEGNIVRVADRKVLDAEDQAAREKAKALIQAEVPETEVFRLGYSTAREVMPQVTPLLSPRGKAVIDDRSNAVVLTDISGNRGAIVRLLRNLDTQTPQISIEARVVEARSTWTRQIGVQWGFSGNASTAGGNPTGLVFPSSIGVAGGATDAQTPTAGFLNNTTPDLAVNLPIATGTGSGGAIGFTFGSLAGNLNVALRLSAAETEGTIRIISAPKITVLNNRPASISQGVSIPISVVSAAGTQTQFVPADLKLTTTPHVSSRDCTITLEVEVTKNEADFVNTGARGDPSIQRKEAKTTMLIADGETSVIGGVYTRNSGVSYSKIPWFADIPILGFFFRNRRENDDRTEVLIFLTPRITNKASLRCETVPERR